MSWKAETFFNSRPLPHFFSGPSTQLNSWINSLICLYSHLVIVVQYRASQMTTLTTHGTTPERTTSNDISSLSPPVVPLTYHGSSDNEKPHSLYRDIESRSLADENVSYPEGGKGWLVVFGSFCGMLAALGLMNSIGRRERSQLNRRQVH